jgi:hypothetical protein
MRRLDAPVLYYTKAELSGHNFWWGIYQSFARNPTLVPLQYLLLFDSYFFNRTMHLIYFGIRWRA